MDNPLYSMFLFGVIMIALTVQLIIAGLIIRRGKYAWLTDMQKRKVADLPHYCRLFGNKLILLGLIAAVCSYMAMTSTEVNLRPIIVFGIGLVLVAILMIIDYRRCSR